MMLRRGDMSVKETGESLGFSDQFHFSKTFKKSLRQKPLPWQRNSGLERLGGIFA